MKMKGKFPWVGSERTSKKYAGEARKIFKNEVYVA